MNTQSLRIHTTINVTKSAMFSDTGIYCKQVRFVCVVQGSSSTDEDDAAPVHAAIHVEVQAEQNEERYKFEVLRMVIESLGRNNTVLKDMNGDSSDVPAMVDLEELDVKDDDHNIDEDNMAELLQESQIPLFTGLDTADDPTDVSHSTGQLASGGRHGGLYVWMWAGQKRLDGRLWT